MELNEMEKKLTVLIPHRRILLGTFHNDALKTVRNIRYFLRRRLNLFPQMLDRDCHRGITVKRNMPRDHLIHRDARGVYVALLVHNSAPRLLRRSVVHRSHHVGADPCSSKSSPARSRNPSPLLFRLWK